MFLSSDRIKGAGFDRAAVLRVRADWAAQIGRSVQDIERAYADHLANLRALAALDGQARKPSMLSRFTGADPAADRQMIYRFALCFADGKFLAGAGGRAATQQQLNLTHSDHIALIDQLLAQPDITLTDTPLPRQSGTQAEVIEAALHLYFHHTAFGPQGARLRQEASLRIPALLRHAPYLGSNLTAALLADHPDLAAQAGALVFEVYGGAAPGPDFGIWGSVALDMLGVHSQRDNPFRRAGPKIIGRVLDEAAHWSGPQIACFVQAFALMPLSLDLGTQDQEAARARADIARDQDQLAKGFDHDTGPLRPAQLEDLCRKRLAKAQARLDQIETDFASLHRDHITAAAKHLMTATSVRRVVQAMVTALPGAATQVLQQVLDEVEVIKARPKRFPMPRASDNRFRDFGFKMMVIQELMYDQKRLKPIFDLRRFAAEWTERDISIEDDGYEIIPEVSRYFKSLAIPDAELAHVTVLTQKSGLDGTVGGAMDQLHPFLDPGVGDGPIPVTNKAVADLDLLPNLRCVVGLENQVNTPRPTKLIKALQARGIAMIDEDLAIWGKP